LNATLEPAATTRAKTLEPTNVSYDDVVDNDDDFWTSIFDDFEEQAIADIEIVPLLKQTHVISKPPSSAPPTTTSTTSTSGASSSSALAAVVSRNIPDDPAVLHVDSRNYVLGI
jgi:hypothetical protein